MRRRTLASTRAASLGLSPLAGSSGVGAAKPFAFDGEPEGAPSDDATSWVPEPVGGVEGCGVANGCGVFDAVTACARWGARLGKAAMGPQSSLRKIAQSLAILKDRVPSSLVSGFWCRDGRKIEGTRDVFVGLKDRDLSSLFDGTP